MPVRPVSTAILIGGMLAGCHSTGSVGPPATIVQPGAPGQPSRSISAADASNLSQVRHTAADVAFMQGMIAHHAQALEMTALLQSRTDRDDMRRMAERIDLSQSDEIEMMRTWLRGVGARVPDEHAHHGHDLMPGMLTAEQMERLAAARGPAFDRLFLEGMIAHHEGALAMVSELMKQPGAGQASDVFEFVADVEADQRMEIARMAAMLQELSR